MRKVFSFCAKSNNITAEIAANNKSFIEEYKKENGVEPSFFKKRPWLRE